MMRMETRVKGQVSGNHALEDGHTRAGSGGGGDAPAPQVLPRPGVGPGPCSPAPAPGQTCLRPDCGSAGTAQRLCNAVLGFLLVFFSYKSAFPREKRSQMLLERGGQVAWDVHPSDSGTWQPALLPPLSSPALGSGPGVQPGGTPQHPWLEHRSAPTPTPSLWLSLHRQEETPSNQRGSTSPTLLSLKELLWGRVDDSVPLCCIRCCCRGLRGKGHSALVPFCSWVSFPGNFLL